jgi:hypothetical protein
MATFECEGLDDLALSMEEISQIPDDIKADMLNAQADIVLRAQKRSGQSMGVYRSGATLGALKKGKAKKNKDGSSILISFSGKNADGNRNAEVAFLNEFGKRNVGARPFIRVANETAADEAVRASLSIYDNWLKSKNL